MIFQSFANSINNIREKCFDTAERKRLHNAYKRILEHQKQCQDCLEIRKDFMIKGHDLAKEDYRQLLEHYGIEFWTHYYENEHPTCIFNHSLAEHAQYRAYKDQKNLEDYILLPSNSSLAR